MGKKPASPVRIHEGGIALATPPCSEQVEPPPLVDTPAVASRTLSNVHTMTTIRNYRPPSYNLTGSDSNMPSKPLAFFGIFGKLLVCLKNKFLTLIGSLWSLPSR